jgi:hypothetical protein
MWWALHEAYFNKNTIYTWYPNNFKYSLQYCTRGNIALCMRVVSKVALETGAAAVVLCEKVVGHEFPQTSAVTRDMINDFLSVEFQWRLSVCGASPRSLEHMDQYLLDACTGRDGPRHAAPRALLRSLHQPLPSARAKHSENR